MDAEGLTRHLNKSGFRARYDAYEHATKVFVSEIILSDVEDMLRVEGFKTRKTPAGKVGSVSQYLVSAWAW